MTIHHSGASERQARSDNVCEEITASLRPIGTAVQIYREEMVTILPDSKFDSDQADRDRARNTHPAPRAPRAVPVAAIDDAGFVQARTVREHYGARLAKLEYEQRATRLPGAREFGAASQRIHQIFQRYMFADSDVVIVRRRDDGRRAIPFLPDAD